MPMKQIEQGIEKILSRVQDDGDVGLSLSHSQTANNLNVYQV